MNRIQQEHFSADESDTIALARRLAPSLRNGDILCLSGTLGMGKSVFARALIRHLCGDDTLEVPSPTFTLVQHYEIAHPHTETGAAQLWHFDLYRLKDPEEIYELGWEDALYDGISLVEWPERLGALKPRHAIDVVFSKPEQTPDTHRRIAITGGAE
ncbi:MAG: tRNA (adenosine(37)-N6)-threonylcarbamoyltransferase complex ATPase subunit type 1 TsaE [Alphaproteobacteria bacterium]